MFQLAVGVLLSLDDVIVVVVLVVDVQVEEASIVLEMRASSCDRLLPFAFRRRRRR